MKARWNGRAGRPGDARRVRVPVEDGRTRRNAFEGPQVERLAEPRFGEHEIDGVGASRHGRDKAVGSGRLSAATRTAGDLLVDAGHGHGSRHRTDLERGRDRGGRVEQPGVIRRLCDRHREGDQPVAAPGDVVESRWRRYRLRPGDSRHDGGEVLAPEASVTRGGAVAGRLAARLDHLARVEHECRGGRRGGPDGDGDTGNQDGDDSKEEVPWRRAL